MCIVFLFQSDSSFAARNFSTAPVRWQILMGGTTVPAGHWWSRYYDIVLRNVSKTENQTVKVTAFLDTASFRPGAIGASDNSKIAFHRVDLAQWTNATAPYDFTTYNGTQMSKQVDLPALAPGASTSLLFAVEFFGPNNNDIWADCSVSFSLDITEDRGAMTGAIQSYNTLHKFQTFLNGTVFSGMEAAGEVVMLSPFLATTSLQLNGGRPF